MDKIYGFLSMMRKKPSIRSLFIL